MMTKQWIGIDVSRAELKIARSEGEQWKIETIENATAPISRWIRSLDSLGAVQLVLEATGTYSSKLVHALHRFDVPFSVITPRQASQFSGVLNNITKNDERDACCLSLYGRHMQPPLYQMPSPQQERLKQLYTLLGQLKKQRQAINNQLHALSQHANPVQTALDVMQQTASFLSQQIETIEQEICAHTGPELQILVEKTTSVKGIGPKTALALLVATDGLKHFTDVKQLVKFVGLAPKQHRSGTLATKAHINRAADPELRALLYMATWSACKSNKACIELRKRLKNKGKAPKVILIALAHKLLRQVWGVLKNDRPFDNDFEKNLAAA